MPGALWHGFDPQSEPSAQEWIEQPSRIRALLLNRFDVKPQSGKRLGKKFEIIGAGGRARRILIDLLLAHLQELVGLGQAEHLQRALDLTRVTPESGQLTALAGIAEKRVK